MRRTLAVLLSLAGLAGLAACGQGSPDEADPSGAGDGVEGDVQEFGTGPKLVYDEYSVLFTNPTAGNGAVGPFPAEMTRRNAFRGPGYWNMDAGLYKRIRFSEKYSLQLRLEAFNVFNHANLFVDVNNLDASGTTAVTALRGVFPSGNLERRNVQLAAKFVF